MEELECVCGHGEYDHHESSGECRECDCICFVVRYGEAENETGNFMKLDEIR